jgi:integrase
MSADAKARKRRTRAYGQGTVYQRGRIWWVAYNGPDGKRVTESSHSTRKGVAVRMLQRRIGNREIGAPVIPRVEQYTFDEAAQAKIDDSTNRGRTTVDELERRIKLHLLPYFGGRRLISIQPGDIRAFTAKRRADTIVTRKARTLDDDTVTREERKPVSNGEINRELEALKSIFRLALKDGRLAQCPHIERLEEHNARKGFFEREQFDAVVKHLPEELRPVLTFAYITGWRIASEVLPLEWRNADLKTGEVRLDVGTTKNREGRVFVMTTALRTVLQAQHTKHEQLKKAGHIVPQVFWRMVADGRGGPLEPKPIKSINKAFKAACRAAGLPGRIPHDLRRTAVRNLDRAGVPRSVAMAMVGHKTEAIYRRYRIVDAVDLRDAARRLDRSTSPWPVTAVSSE